VRCEHNLRMIAARKCVFWGGLANLCLINLVVSTFRYENDIEDPTTTGTILMSVGLIPLIIVCCLTKCKKKRIGRVGGSGNT